MSKRANRREDSRIGPLLVRAEFMLGGRLCRAYVTNLSRGGAFLATGENIPTGQAITLVISLPWNLGRIEVEARVMWKRDEASSADRTHSAGIGVHFDSVDPETRRLIDDYLTEFRGLAERLPASPV